MSALNILVSAMILALGASAATNDPGWKEVSRNVMGGTGGWDLLSVDPESRHVFVTRGDHLMIVDLDAGKLVGDLASLNRAHGVAVVPSLHRGFVSSGGDDQVVVFDLTTFQRVGDIPAGKNPDAVIFDSASGHVLAFNGNSNDATVIDPSTDKVVVTVALPGKPELAVSDSKGRVFVNLEDKNQIAALDSKKNKVVATWSLGSCEEPSGLAIDIRHQRLFAVCSNHQMAVVDAGKGTVITTVPIGEGPDGATFDPASSNAFSSNSDGTLTIVHEDDPNHFSVIANVQTPRRSRTITLDEKTHHVVLPFAEFGDAAAPSAQNPHPRPAMKADSFGLVTVGQP